MPEFSGITSSSYFDKLSMLVHQVSNGRLLFDGECPRIGREQFRRGIRRFVDEPELEYPLVIKNCPFCKTPIISLNNLKHWKDDLDALGLHKQPNSVVAVLEHCTNCLYWRWHYLYSEIGDRGILWDHYYKTYLSKIREFDVELPNGCVGELAQQFRRLPNLWNSITPKRLEAIVADIFKANYAKAEVMHVGKPDDGGVDVLYIDDHKRQWLIQVKRREHPSSSEGISTVRNLLGAMVLNSSCYGIVVSTADHFTFRALQAVGNAKEHGMTISLLDKGKINRMLDPLLPDRPWIPLVREDLPQLLENFAEKVPSSRQLLLF